MQILALLNVAMEVGTVVFMTIITPDPMIIAVHAMPLATREMIAVQMHRFFVWVSTKIYKGVQLP